MNHTPLSRRKVLGGLSLAGLAGGGILARQAIGATHAEAERIEQRKLQAQRHEPSQQPHTSGAGASTDPHRDLHGSMFVVGEVDHAANGFNPTDMLTDFDYGTISTLPNGQTLREYTIVSSNKTIEVAPGVSFSAWVYNGRCPGPFIRATEGDRVRITFINGSDHPHSMHFHGIHEANMDGVLPVKAGETFVYEFDAAPFGLHLYHCHVPPFMRHLHKGLYGLFIVDPKTPRPVAKEMAMVMNAFDVNFDGANEIYAVNSIGFHYTKHPIPLKVGELACIYVANLTEFDPINSFHLHAQLFNYFDTGTALTPSAYTDVIMQCQAQRGIIEFKYDRPGVFMFHAHQSEFNQLGWMGLFEVTDTGAASAPGEVARRLGFDLA
jgi:FtsP/CotA-like multicopper oxidase with cupredoxin domain